MITCTKVGGALLAGKEMLLKKEKEIREVAARTIVASGSARLVYDGV